VFVGIAGFLLQSRTPAARPPLAGDTTMAIGRALVGSFAVTLELLGLLLLVALLGALYFARTEE
jgi:NADH:ubiquinone oxidoreductase subunit 6 (subunit J)